MPQIDQFWDEIVDDGLVDPDQAGRARARFIQVGGGLDTAVLEMAPLDVEGRATLLTIAARALGREKADPAMLVDLPEPAACALVPREVMVQYGVLPMRLPDGRMGLVVPPLAPHVYSAVRSKLGRAFEARLALEIDLRLVLAERFDLPLPARFEALRLGRRPSGSRLSGVTAVSSPPAAIDPKPPPGRAWVQRAVDRLAAVSSHASLRRLLGDAGQEALDGRYYLLTEGDGLCCIAGTGLASEGPWITPGRGTRLGQAVRLGSGFLSDRPEEPDLHTFYASIGRTPPLQVLLEPIRDGLQIVGVFVGDHGAKPKI
ncbi:MAG: hypothetical protein KC620_26140, partial [Myxococcales bacterium]|nr:hypothetical protein [Myxococcales bacterium]